MEKKILLVDDEEALLTVMKDTLIMEGYQVKTATNGVAALDVIWGDEATTDQVSLIITDINMPVMNGIELVKEVRKLKRKIPVLAMSAFVEKKMAEKLIYIGVEDIIQKPFIVRNFIEKVRVIFSQS